MTLVTEDNIESMLKALQGANEVAVDTETTGLDVSNGRDYLMGLCLAISETESWYVPFRHKENNIDKRHFFRIMEILENKDLDWHHRKFDMHSIRTMGYDPLKFRGRQFDSMLMFHLWNEEFFSFQMDALAKVFLKDAKAGSKEIHEFGKKVGWSNISAEVMEPYGCHDAVLTLKLKKFVWPKLYNQGLQNVYLETEMPFTALLYEMEQKGVGVDLEFAKRKAEIGRGRMATIRRELKINPASPKDLKKVLLDTLNLPVIEHTSTCQQCKNGSPVDYHDGNPSFNKRVMEEYDTILEALDNPIAKRIAEYRGWQKAVTSLYEPLIERTGPDNRIRTNFKQHGTVTGRLSASEPNLQQVPRGSDKPWNGNAKSSFTSGREGFVLIGWDYSQLELRLAASYGDETILLDEFKKPESDPFRVLCPMIFGKFTPEFRHETKTFVYATAYGAGVKKIALQLGRTVLETEGLYNNYKNSIPGIMNISRRVIELIKERGYVQYWDGRRRHIKNRSEAFKGWNSLCQGGGAQLVKKAMLRCREFCVDGECEIVLQVHDEITFIIRKDLIEKYQPLIEKAMTDWPNMGVTLAVEGKAWNKNELATAA